MRTGLIAFGCETRLLAVAFPVMMHFDLVANLMVIVRSGESRSDGKKCRTSGKHSNDSLFHEFVRFWIGIERRC